MDTKSSEKKAKVPGGPGGRRRGSGRPKVKHGGYSLMVRAGELPQRRAYLRGYLTAVRAGLVQDLGPMEENLSMAQVVLIDRIVSKLSILRCVEEHVRETGVFDKGGELVAVLSKSYLAWANSIRLDLQALGIDKRAGADVLDLGRYLEAKAKNEKTSPAKDSKEAGIVQPARSGDEIRGVEEGARPDEVEADAGELEDPGPGEDRP